MKTKLLLAAIVLFATCAQACADEESDKQVAIDAIPGHDGLVDTRRAQGPRMLRTEAYIRSFTMLLGAKNAAEAQDIAKGGDKSEMFDSWNHHLDALGLPDYKEDIRRATETNTLMLAAFERLGMAACERAAERDLRDGGSRIVFDFELAADPLDRAAFDKGFDIVHRTMLGYPASLAAGRSDRFFELYRGVVSRHGDAAVVSRLSPAEAGWAVVCEGLVRHPEFHLY